MDCICRSKKVTVLRVLRIGSLSVFLFSLFNNHFSQRRKVNRVLTVCQFLAWFKTVDLFATGKSEKLPLKPSWLNYTVAMSINVHNIIGAAPCSFRFNADPINRACASAVRIDWPLQTTASVKLFREFVSACIMHCYVRISLN